MTSGLSLCRFALLRNFVLLTCGLTQVSWAAPPEAKRLEFFENRIRPALVSHCYECHSDKNTKGGLRLDYAGGITSGGDSGPAIVSGRPDQSLLVEAIHFEGLEMPPGGRLPASVIRDFEEWVRDGAIDPRIDPGPASTANGIDIEKGKQFWAFQPVRDTRPPKQSGDATASQIDQYVNAQLTAAGLSPSAQATRSTLVRRLYFDLTGLPPTSEQLAAAIDDPATEAIDRLIDVLLNSPQYGIHWGRHWLDVARYADSNGGDFNATFHNAWRYREYVVDSFAKDTPYNTFVREQIAGDLLPYDDDIQRSRQLVATGFLMIGSKMLSERDKEKLTMDVVDEQISTVGSTFLGLTLGCSRCHDHKFDPIPARDYYALAGIFRSTRTLKGESQKYVSTWERTELPASKAQTEAITGHRNQEKQLTTAISELKKQIEELQNNSSHDPRFVVDDQSAHIVGDWQHSTRTPTYVGSSYLHDNRANKGQMSVEFRWKPPATGRYQVRLSYTHGSTRAKSVPVSIRHSEGTRTTTLDQTRKPEFSELFSAVGEYNFDEATEAVVTVSNKGTTGFVIVDAVKFSKVNNDDTADDKSRSATTAAELQLKEFRQALQQKEAALKELQKNRPAPLPQAIAAVDLDKPADCALRIRGEHKNPGEVVPRGFIQVAHTYSMSPIDESASGRQQLAEWLVQPDHPLTGRVIVNRVWAQLFGEGLVRTVDNFGKLGERPTHPQLLDHLARRFVTARDKKTASGASGLGWSIRSLIRELVATQAYQRSTSYNEDAWRVDPENRLLWRMNRRRIPAESIRDGMLTVSRRLDLSPGASPVEGLGTLVKSNSADADEYERTPSARRSIYMPIIRNELPSVLTVFDFADPDFVVGKRSITNVPAQALFLLNSPFVMNNAEEAAKWILENDDDSGRAVISLAYRSALSREPAESELHQALEYLQSDFDEAGSEEKVARLAKLIHVLFASSEFRILD